MFYHINYSKGSILIGGSKHCLALRGLFKSEVAPLLILVVSVANVNTIDEAEYIKLSISKFSLTIRDAIILNSAIKSI